MNIGMKNYNNYMINYQIFIIYNINKKNIYYLNY